MDTYVSPPPLTIHVYSPLTPSQDGRTELERHKMVTHDLPELAAKLQETLPNLNCARAGMPLDAYDTFIVSLLNVYSKLSSDIQSLLGDPC